jgi:acyl carrier protein
LGSVPATRLQPSSPLLHWVNGSTGVEARKLPGEANVHDQIRNELREFIGDNYLFGDHDRLPDDEASLLEEGIVDSTGVLELIEFLEDHFEIVVGESETVFENLGSVGGLTRFVASKTLAEQPVG